MQYFSHIAIVSTRSQPLDYSAVATEPRHDWNLENQLIPMIPIRDYENEWRDRTKLLNPYSKQRAEDHLSEGALGLMWATTKI